MSVVPSTVTSLFETATEVLHVAEDALATTGEGTPARSYVSPDEPAFDCCPFLTVHTPFLTEGGTSVAGGGLAGGHRTMSGSVILASYVVLAIRCAVVAEQGQLPSLTRLEAVASQVYQDGWALWNYLRAAIKDETIFGLCREVYFDGGQSVPSQGGCVGWRFTIRASIDGIPSEGS